MLRCSNCGWFNPDDAPVCEMCGEELRDASKVTVENEISHTHEEFSKTVLSSNADCVQKEDIPEEEFCPMCGYPVTDECITCPNCGYALAEPVIEQNDSIAHSPGPEEDQGQGKTVSNTKGTVMELAVPKEDSVNLESPAEDSLSASVDAVPDVKPKPTSERFLKGTVRDVTAYMEPDAASSGSTDLTIPNLENSAPQPDVVAPSSEKVEPEPDGHEQKKGRALKGTIRDISDYVDTEPPVDIPAAEGTGKHNYKSTIRDAGKISATVLQSALKPQAYKRTIREMSDHEEGNDNALRLCLIPMSKGDTEIIELIPGAVVIIGGHKYLVRK